MFGLKVRGALHVRNRPGNFFEDAVVGSGTQALLESAARSSRRSQSAEAVRKNAC